MLIRIRSLLGHQTQVILDRHDDGIASESYWLGVVTSTYNQ